MMEGNISPIKKLEMKKPDVNSIVIFDKELSNDDLKFLEDEFDFFKEDIDKFLANYKNIGVVFKLTPIREGFKKEWRIFLNNAIKKSYEFSKFNNLFVGNGYDKILFVTCKRLLKIDLEKLNEVIEEINYRIEGYNTKIDAELRDIPVSIEEEKKGFFKRIRDIIKG